MSRGKPLPALAIALAAVLVLASAAGQPRQAVAGTTDQRAELLTLTNRDRAAAGLPALVVLASINGLAQWRSQDMADRGYFSHDIPPSGENVFAVMSRDGIPYSIAGENIGWNNYPIDGATAAIEQSFMASPGHRANILGAWKYIGVGYAANASGVNIWTVLFLAPSTPATPMPTTRPAPPVVPVPSPRPTPRLPSAAPTTCGG